MSESPSNKSKIIADYWAAGCIGKEPQITVTFFPYDTLEIDLEGNLSAQIRDQVKALYGEQGEHYDDYKHYDCVQDSNVIDQMFSNHICIPITYKDE